MFSTTFFIIQTLVSLSVIGSVTAEDNSDRHIETVRDYEDHMLVRSRRSDNTELCVYNKGQWSDCNKELDIISREDQLERQLSSLSCDPTRTLYRKCNERTSKKSKDTTCVFEKPKTVPWTGCLDIGLTQKVLHLVSEEGGADCPKQKLISRKCGEDKQKKKKKRNKKKEERKSGENKAAEGENQKGQKRSKKEKSKRRKGLPKQRNQKKKTSFNEEN